MSLESAYISATQQVDCRIRYFDLIFRQDSPEVFLLTALAIVLTVLLETTIHLDIKKPPPSISSPDPNAPAQTPDPSPPPPAHLAAQWCTPNPSPRVRANRLLAATFLLAPISTCFGFRMYEARDPGISAGCRRFFSARDAIYPDWGVVFVFNVVPLVVALSAWLRTLVDCFLVRRGRGLGYWADRGERVPWPVCAPVSLVPLVLFTLGRGVVLRLMGVVDGEGPWEQVELEEGRRLVDGIDEGEGEEEDGGKNKSWGVGDVDSPPAYSASRED